MSYVLRLEGRENGEVREIEFPSRGARAVYNFDVHKYRYSLRDPDVEGEFDDLPIRDLKSA